jgi:hypothetical protein
MKVPFTTADFLDRAVEVYPRRTGVVDEPGEHQDGGRGSQTYADLATQAAALAAGLDELGPGGRRPGRRGQPQQRAAARAVLRRHRLGPGAGAGQLPAVPRRGRLHRRALRRAGAAGRPGGRRRARRRHRRAPVRAGQGVRRRPAAARGGAPAVGGAGRGRDGDHQLHERHDRPTQGRADHAPQHLGQRRHLRAARRRHRPRRLPAHPADVPRQRVGDAVRADRPGCAAGGAAQDRRRRDPAPGRAVRRHAHVRRAGRRRVRARGRPGVGGGGARPRPHAHRRRPALRRPAGPSSGSRRSWAGSSSRSTGSPRPRRCSP